MSEIKSLIEIVAKLRDPDTGCPWDIKQSHQSISDCLIDECCELLQTIDRMDMEHMEEELGDVLLQVIFHAQIAKENGDFDFESVCRVLREKLIRRHPHVFGNVQESINVDAVLDRWEMIKSKEKKRGHSDYVFFKDLPRQLPALMFAEDIHKQITKNKFKSTKIYSETLMDSVNNLINAETSSDSCSHSVGKVLYHLTACCRDMGVDAEAELRRYTQSIVDDIESVSK